MEREHRVATPDGRRLRVIEDGDPSGAPILVHHGTPSAARLYRPHVEDARARGIRLIAYDRPGYGGSAPARGRTVGDVAGDVAAIADALGLERLSTWGISGGGPHALACAALLPDRVVAAGVLASPAPWGAEGLDWFAGMGEDNIVEFTAALEGRAACEPLLVEEAEAMRGADLEGLVESMRSLVSPVDDVVLTGELGAHFFEVLQAGVAGGVEGWVEDDLAFARPWGFAPGDAGVPVLLWHGAHDRFVPIAHGRWLAERIPGVDARLSEEDGHITLYERRIPGVHAWLLERF